MAQMNKRPAGSGGNRRSALESELIGDIEGQKQLMDTGRDRVVDGNEFHRKEGKKAGML